MSKSLHECVAKLLANPRFNPKIGSGKADKTKEEIAYAICQTSIAKECDICVIEDDKAFLEMLDTLIKEMGTTKNTDQYNDLITGQLNLESKQEISKEDLDKINKLTLKPVSADDVVVYPAMLIDDQITRNNTMYNKDFQNTILSLPVGEGNFIGAPVLFGNGKDHQEVASAQVGRIFDAYQVIDKEKHYGILGKMFILKEGNESLITKVDAGVLKEVSIAAKVEFPMCSICKQNIQTCEHERGVNGCYAIMSGNGFCGEVSFVAVPGSDQAKILKNEDLSNYVKLEASFELFKESIKQVITESKIDLTMFNEINANVKLVIERLNKIEANGSAIPAPTTIIETPAPKPTEEELKKESLNIINNMVKDTLITETVRLGTLIDKIEIKDKEVAKKFFMNLSNEEIIRIKDMFFKEGKELFIEKKVEEVQQTVVKKNDIRAISKKILNKEDK